MMRRLFVVAVVLGRHWWLLCALAIVLLLANQAIGQGIARLVGGR